MSDFFTNLIEFLKNNFFSLVGCITGIFGSVFSLFLYFNDKIKIKVSYMGISYLGPLPFSNVFDDMRTSTTTYSLDNCVCSILVIVSNNSKTPTAVKEIWLNNKYCLNSYSGQVQDIPEMLIKNGEHLISNGNTHIVSDDIFPIFELKPYSCIRGYINFFDIKNNINFNKKIKLTFKCVQKSCSVKLKISPMVTKVIE